jgi:2-polyprenyl-3-methyl-5-hydroxy-6-metoxy-1,4-benzoquinol methylase
MRLLPLTPGPRTVWPGTGSSRTIITMSEQGYLLDKERREAHRRLRNIEALEDPDTTRILERIGVATGWRCAEVGAGAGSIARWLDERVGSEGNVVAADLQTDILENVGAGGAEIRKMDLESESLEETSYDLVHCRNVLVHLADSEAGLRRLLEAVRPGGWIFVEEPDLVADQADPELPADRRELYARGTGAIFAFLCARGHDVHFGGRIFGILDRLGCEALEAVGLARTFRGGDPQHLSPHADAFAELRDLVVAEQPIDAATYDAFLALYRDPGFSWREGLRMMVWGRRPRAALSP